MRTLIAARFSLIISILVAGSVRAQTVSAEPPVFPIPQRVVSLSETLTPHQYTAVIAAIKREVAKPTVSKELEQGPGLGPLGWISAALVPLGSLGDGIMVNFGHSPSCGTGGCPMWLLLHDSFGYHVVIRGAGWGYSTMSLGNSVPDVAFYWQMSASETDISQYHFAKNEFVPITANPAKCDREDDKQGGCAAIFSEHSVWSLTPAEYGALRRQVTAATKSSPAVSQPTFANRAHALDFPLVNNKIARVVGIGDCTQHSNCKISIYGCNQSYLNPSSHDRAEESVPRCEYWPMLTGVSGWGVVNTSDWTTDPFSPRLAFVIVRRLSAREMELERYSVASETTGRQPGDVLVSDSCEIVSPQSGRWAPHWDAQMLSARSEKCGK